VGMMARKMMVKQRRTLGMLNTRKRSWIGIGRLWL
jgi:hypothetical protein